MESNPEREKKKRKKIIDMNSKEFLKKLNRAPLAQLVEYWSYEPMVSGSSPLGSSFVTN